MRSLLVDLLEIVRFIDALNEFVGKWVKWLALGAVLVSAGNALSRYTFSLSSNAWLELQWYMFSALFLLAAGYALKHNDHVRLDVLFTRYTPRTQAWVDIFGTIFFLLPLCLLILWHGWPFFYETWLSGERSGDSGGLIRWPVKLFLPLGFALLVLQAFAELIKRFAFLQGLIPNPLLIKEKVR
jgi:TRAP-type mannitol/chloroaromatic compound transport system permease small subunit